MLSDKTINRLKEISKAAGEQIMEIYQESDFGIEHKKDDSPLTKADQASNKIICAGLQSLSEQYPIVSEENKNDGYDIRKDYSKFWLVDPLDGTKEFIKRNGEFTTNIALIENGKPVAGFVYVPASKKMYWSLKGKGAFREDQDGVHQVTCDSFHAHDEGLTVVASRSHMDENTQNFIAKLNNAKTIQKGSSLKFLSIVDGDAHYYPRIAPTMEWDTAAAHAILEEAGGRVFRYEDDQDLIYNKENLLNPYFVAVGKLLS